MRVSVSDKRIGPQLQQLEYQRQSVEEMRRGNDLEEERLKLKRERLAIEREKLELKKVKLMMMGCRQTDDGVRFVEQTTSTNKEQKSSEI